MKNSIIRPANLADLETLYGFEQGVILAERPYDLTLKEGEIHYYDIKELITAPHIELLVAEIEGKVVASGYARIEAGKPYLRHKKQAYLGFMFVVAEYRGKGINRLIIEGLKKWAAKLQISELRLDVYAENEAAIRAYEKTGFVQHMIQMRLGLTE